MNEQTWRKILLSEQKKSQVAVVEQKENLIFRTPTEEDGKEVWQLIKNTGVLDLNSSYSYLMWSKFLMKQVVIVEENNKLSVLFLVYSTENPQIRFLFGK